MQQGREVIDKTTVSWVRDGAEYYTVRASLGRAVDATRFGAYRAAAAVVVGPTYYPRYFIVGQNADGNGVELQLLEIERFLHIDKITGC